VPQAGHIGRPGQQVRRRLLIPGGGHRDNSCSSPIWGVRTQPGEPRSPRMAVPCQLSWTCASALTCADQNRWQIGPSRLRAVLQAIPRRGRVGSVAVQSESNTCCVIRRRNCRHASSLDPAPRNPMVLDLALRHAELARRAARGRPHLPAAGAARCRRVAGGVEPRAAGKEWGKSGPHGPATRTSVSSLFRYARFVTHGCRGRGWRPSRCRYARLVTGCPRSGVAWSDSSSCWRGRGRVGSWRCRFR